MVQRADEVVDGRVRREVPDERAVGRADPLALEGDQDVDLRCVVRLQAGGLGEVGGVAGPEGGEGDFGRGEELDMKKGGFWLVFAVREGGITNIIM